MVNRKISKYEKDVAKLARHEKEYIQLMANNNKARERTNSTDDQKIHQKEKFQLMVQNSKTQERDDSTDDKIA